MTRGRDEGEADDGLALVVDRLLSPLRLEATSIAVEATNADYGAVTCEVAGRTVRIRSARLTPKKVGLFVAHWRRADGGSTEPFDAAGSADLVIVTVVEGDLAGAFLFTRRALVAHGILASLSSAGKRGFRVYPPWSAAPNPQAARTQRWQGDFFVALPPGGADTTRATVLLDQALEPRS